MIRFLDEIPKGPDGQASARRVGGPLGIEPLDDRRDDAEHVPPRSAAERDIAEVWAELFPGSRIGVRTRFEALGGDSLLAVRMLAEVSERLGRDVPYLVFAEDGTIEALAAALEADAGAATSALVALRAGGAQAAALLHSGSRRRPARHRPARPRAAVQPARCGRSTFDGSSAPQRRGSRGQCLDLLLAHDPHGPYHLVGVCFGGVVATELARQLIARGKAGCVSRL